MRSYLLIPSQCFPPLYSCTIIVTGYWEMSHLAYSILLAHLIDTLIHCLCTVALTGLADWSTFLELVLPTM